MYYFILQKNLIDEYVVVISFIWLSTVMLFQFTGLYHFEAIIRPWAVIDKLLIAFSTAFLFLFAIAFALKVSEFYSRLWVGSFAVSSCSLTIFARILVAIVIEKLSDMRLFSRNAIVAGSGKQAAHLLKHLQKHGSRFVSVAGVFTDDPSLSSHDLDRNKVLGRMDCLIPYVRANEIDDIFLAMPWSAEQEIMALVEKFRELPVNVYLISDLIGFRIDLREPPGHFDRLPIREIMGRPLSGWDVVTKSAFDYLIAGIAVIALLPFAGLVALAIKIDSPGPVFFRQKRLGFNNKEFTIYKFRSMQDALSSDDRTVQARPNDPRVTRLGRILRRTSIDELPQLINVLNGSMSLVGPRPHAIDHNEEYSRKIRGYFSRHRVKPGITGWAQVNGWRGETDTVEKMQRRVEYDIYYTDNWSLSFDLQILARTLVICLTGRNAY